MKHVSIKLLLALCALITPFTGCSLLNEPDQVTNRYSSIETTAYSTNVEYSSVRTYKETVYALVNRYDATTNSLYHSVIKLENNNSETLFEMVNGENTYASDLCVVSENEFILTMNIFDEDQPDKCKITRYSEKGIATDEFTLPGHCKAISDDEGTLYIIGEDDEGKPFFAVTDSDSQIKIQQNIDLQSLNDGVVTSDGSVVLVGTNSYGDKQLKRWDESKKEIVDYPIGDSDTDYQTLIQSHSNDFLFYFTSYDGIFGMKQDGTIKKILDFINSDMKSSEIVTCTCTANDEFYIVLSNENATSIQHFVPNTEIKDKIITVATANYDENLVSNIVDFNRNGHGFRIVLEEYTGDKTTATNTLFANLEGNSPPDLIFIDSFDMDMQYAATEELFTDMYTFMENDNEVNTTTLMPNYQKANEVQGELLALGYTYCVSTVVANADLIGNRTSWNFTEFLSICRSCEESGIELFDLQNSISFMDFALRGDPLIDYSNNACYFDESYFTDYLNFSSELTVHEDPDFSNATQEEVDLYFHNEDKKYETGKRLMYITELGEYSDYLMAISMFGNKPTSVIGFPTQEGTDCRNYLEPSPDRLSISSESKYKQQAWQFVKQYLNSDANYVYGFPVFVDETKEFLNYNVGNTWEHLGENIPATTQADIDQFYNFLLSADKIGNYSLSNAVFYGLIQNSDSYLMPSDQVAEAMQSECEQYLRHIN